MIIDFFIFYFLASTPKNDLEMTFKVKTHFSKFELRSMPR